MDGAMALERMSADWDGSRNAIVADWHGKIYTAIVTTTARMENAIVQSSDNEP